MMKSVVFSCNDVAVKINSDDEDIIKYLKTDVDIEEIDF